MVAYGHILKPHVLEIPPRGMLNVHASLLPALRGAAPIQWAIRNGDTETGVTIMQMEAGLDSGPTFLQRRTPIRPDDTAATLAERLSHLGAEALVDTLALLGEGRIAPTPQDHARATHAPEDRPRDGAHRLGRARGRRWTATCGRSIPRRAHGRWWMARR